MQLPEYNKNKWLIIFICQAILILAIWAYAVVYISETNTVEVNGFVNDFAQIIDLDSLDKIRKVCIGIKEKTGIDVILVTINSAKPYATNEYASRILKKWIKRTENTRGGILMLISKGEGTITLEVSPSINFVLPKSVGSKILEDHVIPKFDLANDVASNKIKGKEGESINKIIGKGIYDGIVAIITRISDISKLEIFKKQIETATKNTENVDLKLREKYLIYLYIALIFILTGIVFVVYRLLVHRCDKCNHRINLKNEIIQIPTKTVPGLTVRSYSCEKCGFSEDMKIVTYYKNFMFNQIISVIRGIFISKKRRRRREKRKVKFRKKNL